MSPDASYLANLPSASLVHEENLIIGCMLQPLLQPSDEGVPDTDEREVVHEDQQNAHNQRSHHHTLIRGEHQPPAEVTPMVFIRFSINWHVICFKLAVRVVEVNTNILTKSSKH